MKAAKLVLAPTLAKALATYRRGKNPGVVVVREMAKLEDILAETMYAAHLAGWLGIAVPLREYLKKQLKLSVHGSAVARFEKLIGISEAARSELKAKYSSAAVEVVKDSSDAVNLKLLKKMRDMTARGVHVREGVRELGDAMAASGITPSSSFNVEAIFRTQTSAAYSAGRWEAAQEPGIAEYIWGFTYITAGDDRVRERHIGLHNVTLKKDDPRWASIWPVNGWACRCTTIEHYGPEKIVQPKKGAGADKDFNFNIGRMDAQSLAATWVSPSAPFKVAKLQKRMVELYKIVQNKKGLYSESAITQAFDERNALKAKRAIWKKEHPDWFLTKAQKAASKSGMPSNVTKTIELIEKVKPSMVPKVTLPKSAHKISSLTPRTEAEFAKYMEIYDVGEHREFKELVKHINESPLVTAWRKSLSPAEKKLVYKYSTGTFSGKSKWLSPKVAAEKKLDAILVNAPKHQGVVYRGFRVNTVDFDKLYSKGKVIEYKKASSFSRSQDVARVFAERKSVMTAGNVGKTEVFLELHASSAIDIRSLSVFTNQEEFLMRMGTKVRVKKIIKSKGKIRVILEEISDDTVAIAKTKPPVVLPKVATEYDDISAWKKISGQKGSNPGGVYRDADGKQWYVKLPKTEDIARNEKLAAELYRASGADLPNVKMIQLDGKVGVASEWRDGLESGMHTLTKPKVMKDAHEFFATDAWLGNWDVVGLEYDNLLVNPATGKVFRLDVGGALRYRAQGGAKGAAWGSKVKELDTFRDAKINFQSAKVFGPMTDSEIVASIDNALDSITIKEIRELVELYGPKDIATRKQLAVTLLNRQIDMLEYGSKLEAKLVVKKAVARPTIPVKGIMKETAVEVKKAKAAVNALGEESLKLVPDKTKFKKYSTKFGKWQKTKKLDDTVTQLGARYELEDIQIVGWDLTDKVQYTKLVEQLNAVGEEMYLTLKANPAAKKLYLVGNKVKSVRISKHNMVPDAYGQPVPGQYWPNARMIEMGQQSWGYESVAPKIGGGNWTVCNNWQDVFRHELGHHVYEESLMPVQKKMFLDLFKGSSTGSWGDHLSKYGANNVKEFFAESFSAYTHPKFKAEMFEDVAELLDEVIKGKKVKYASKVAVKKATVKAAPKTANSLVYDGVTHTEDMTVNSQVHMWEHYELKANEKTGSYFLKIFDTGSGKKLATQQLDSHSELLYFAKQNKVALPKKILTQPLRPTEAWPSIKEFKGKVVKNSDGTHFGWSEGSSNYDITIDGIGGYKIRKLKKLVQVLGDDFASIDDLASFAQVHHIPLPKSFIPLKPLKTFVGKATVQQSSISTLIKWNGFEVMQNKTSKNFIFVGDKAEKALGSVAYSDSYTASQLKYIMKEANIPMPKELAKLADPKASKFFKGKVSITTDTKSTGADIFGEQTYVKWQDVEVTVKQIEEEVHLVAYKGGHPMLDFKYAEFIEFAESKNIALPEKLYDLIKQSTIKAIPKKPLVFEGKAFKTVHSDSIKYKWDKYQITYYNKANKVTIHSQWPGHHDVIPEDFLAEVIRYKIPVPKQVIAKLEDAIADAKTITKNMKKSNLSLWSGKVTESADFDGSLILKWDKYEAIFDEMGEIDITGLSGSFKHFENVSEFVDWIKATGKSVSVPPVLVEKLYTVPKELKKSVVKLWTGPVKEKSLYGQKHFKWDKFQAIVDDDSGETCVIGWNPLHPTSSKMFKSVDEFVEYSSKNSVAVPQELLNAAVISPADTLAVTTNTKVVGARSSEMRQWLTGISRTQKKAVKYWSSSGYDVIRAIDTGKKLNPTADQLMKYTNLKKLVAEAPKVQVKEISRGLCRLDAKDFDSYTGVGNVFELRGVASFSTKKMIAHTFDGGSDGLVLMVIKTNKAVDIHSLSNLQHEAEFLIDKGTRYRVVSYEKNAIVKRSRGGNLVHNLVTVEEL